MLFSHDVNYLNINAPLRYALILLMLRNSPTSRAWRCGPELGAHGVVLFVPAFSFLPSLDLLSLFNDTSMIRSRLDLNIMSHFTF
jgi:hypothetical protein